MQREDIYMHSAFDSFYSLKAQIDICIYQRFSFTLYFRIHIFRLQSPKFIAE